MTVNLETSIRAAANSLGLEVYSIDRHPSGALAVYTSEGKKYFLPSSVVGLSESETNAELLYLLAPYSRGVVTEQERPRAEAGIHQAVEDAILVNAEAFEAECRAAAVVAEEKVAAPSKGKAARKPTIKPEDESSK